MDLPDPALQQVGEFMGCYADLERCGGIPEARKQGVLRLEGKNYTVQDGDIITFLFNI